MHSRSVFPECGLLFWIFSSLLLHSCKQMLEILNETKHSGNVEAQEIADAVIWRAAGGI